MSEPSRNTPPGETLGPAAAFWAKVKKPEAPAGEGAPKRTMTIDLTDAEMAALEDLIAKKDLDGPKIFRDSFKVYQAVERGAASVTWHESGPLGMPYTDPPPPEAPSPPKGEVEAALPVFGQVVKRGTRDAVFVPNDGREMVLSDSCTVTPVVTLAAAEAALTASQAETARAVEALERASKLRDEYSRLAQGDGDPEKVLFAIDAEVDAALQALKEKTP
ncbi:MAG: hypothetical protein ACK4FB_07860 [Brevundimonas sp.]|uniref:hypothetical protein n=1 Tax=Brevundimonas sp. TaxID=1871086 RepID=UPI00391C931F